MLAMMNSNANDSNNELRSVVKKTIIDKSVDNIIQVYKRIKSSVLS